MVVAKTIHSAHILVSLHMENKRQEEYNIGKHYPNAKEASKPHPQIALKLQPEQPTPPSTPSPSYTRSCSYDTDADIDATKPLEEQCYYHGVLPRGEINKMLEVEGEFVVRRTRGSCTSEPKPTKSTFTISVLWEQQHYHIEPQWEDGEWRLEMESNSFPSIPALIHFYYKDKIPLNDKSKALLLLPRRLELWQLHNDQITLEKQVGKGNFGEVYIGTLKTQTLVKKVAVKVCLNELGSRSEVEKFLEEATIMRRYNHPNIVKLYGVAATEEPIMLVMEYVDGGSLDKYLRKNLGRLSNSLMTKLCIMASRGMEYLEDKKCIHRDIAARNCLITLRKHLKISDFGLSRIGDEYKIQSKSIPLPVRWTPPEVYATEMYSHKSDVWSFGVLMWEVFSEGEKPYKQLVDNQDVILFIKKGKRLSQPRNCPKDVYTLMRLCWDINHELRPDFKHVRKALEKLYPKIKSKYSSTRRCKPETV